MASTLQRQLAALAAPASSLLRPERRRASIIFSPEEAAKYDRETFYRIGIDGLNELVSICPDLFSPFVNSILFSENAKQFERAVEGSATNDQVDKVVADFLITLSPYIMLKASLKCLEWLVHRFHIEQFNIDPLMQCIIPYYDTKNFVLIIKIIELGGPRDEDSCNWQWLAPSIQSGTALLKSTLYSNVNGPFILWLFQTLRKFVEVHNHHQDNLSTYLGFMVSTMVGVVTKFSREFSMKHQYKNIRSKTTLIHVVLNQVYEFFNEILNDDKYESVQNNREVYSVAYVIIATIGITAEENPEIGDILGSKLKRIFNLLLTNRDLILLEETYLLIETLVHHIYFEWSIKTKKMLRTILEDLAIVSRQWDVSKVVTRLVLANIKKDGGLTISSLLNHLSTIQLSPTTRAEILCKAYFLYKEQKFRRAKNLLTRFETEYPCEFELACKKDATFASDLASLRKGKDFMLLIDHPEEKLRAKAVTQLILKATKVPIKKGVSKKKTIKSAKTLLPDHNATAQALLPRFNDESQLVICALLQHKIKRLLKIFSAGTLLEGCISVLKNLKGLKGKRKAITKLCTLAAKIEADGNLQKQILAAIIPFLFPRKPSGVLTAMKIIKSRFVQQHRILQRFKPLADKSDEDEVTAEEICSHAYNAFSVMDDSLQFGHFGTTNAMEMTIAFLMLKTEEDLPRFLNSASRIGLLSTSDLPVTPTNFGKCLKLADSRNCISVELVLSTILNMKVAHFPTKLLVLKFVWDLSEEASNRGTCMNFLKLFLPKIFPEAVHQFWFWLTALIDVSTLKENDCQNEFHLIRCIQFFASYVKNFGIPAATLAQASSSQVSNGTSNSQGLDKRITRSQGQGDETLKSKTSQKSSKLETSRRKQNSGNGISPTWCVLEILLSRCIQHTSHRVRSLCLMFLEVISNVPNLSFDWKHLLDNVLRYRHEILADSSQAATLIGRAIIDANLAHVRSEIIKALTSPETNRGIFIGLINICQHTGSLMHTELEPMIKKLLETDPESSQLQELMSCFEPSPQSIHLIEKLVDNKGCAKILLKQLNPLLYRNADTAFKKQLFSLMIVSAVTCKNPEVKLAIQRCVRKWEVASSLIAEELNKCLNAERRTASNAARKSNAKEDMENWKDRAEVILEFVQGMKNLTDSKELLSPLFKILKICISLEEQSPVEYLKQLSLTALTLCCAEESDEEVQDGSFQVELVIDCLRCSRNPQTHHHALILLNYAAKRFHEQVLHGVMSLFTFMGNSILRQDDTYSTQLIQQTVTTIIPALTKTARGNEVGRTIVSGGIFRVFTSALQDIPVHRRLPVLTSLVETLNPEESLWQLLIIIVDNALNRDRKRSNLNADLELAVDLAWFYGHNNVIRSLTNVYEFFVSISATVFKDSISDQELRSLKIGQSPMEKAVFDFSRKESYRDIQIVVYYTLELLLKIACKFSDVETEEKLEYDQLLQRCLSFSRIVSGLKDNKIFRLIAQRNLEVVEKINNVLEPEDFVHVIAVILERNDISIQRKILDMLNLRLAQKVEWFGDLEILMPLLPALLEVSKARPDSEEIVTLVQTAFLSMKLIAKHLAFINPENFVDVFQLAMSYATHENHLLCASALLCLGELFCLKSLLLPNLNDITSAILRAFKTSSKLHKLGKELQENTEEKQVKSNEDVDQVLNRLDGDTSLTTAHLLCISTIACMNKMVEQLGPMMGSKFLKKALILLLTIDSQLSAIDSSTTRKRTFDQRLRVLLKTIATKIPVRNSLLPLKGAFQSLIDKPRAAKSIMLILKDALQATSKPDFVLILPSLCDAFLDEFLGCRYSLCSSKDDNLDEEEVSVVEDAIVDCLITGAVLKMSEGTFRPYYHKLFDWAKESELKLITFYRFSASAAERLKSLFVTFAGNVMTEAVDSLRKNLELDKAILSLFVHVFSNDREGFVTTDRFNALVQPLVDMMESEHVVTGQINLKLLSDCLIQLAVASNDLNRWQHMMDLISTKANHSSKKVRLNVISIFEAAASELGKDFLPLLPPVVPFLAELMNDDEPEVESATQKMLLKIESIVGEPLQSYFT